MPPIHVVARVVGVAAAVDDEIATVAVPREAAPRLDDLRRWMRDAVIERLEVVRRPHVAEEVRVRADPRVARRLQDQREQRSRQDVRRRRGLRERGAAQRAQQEEQREGVANALHDGRHSVSAPVAHSMMLRASVMPRRIAHRAQDRKRKHVSKALAFRACKRYERKVQFLPRLVVFNVFGTHPRRITLWRRDARRGRVATGWRIVANGRRSGGNIPLQGRKLGPQPWTVRRGVQPAGNSCGSDGHFSRRRLPGLRSGGPSPPCQCGVESRACRSVRK